ncbi:ElyC/SanA/YdcF family protein [Pseudonocardia nematodicida]|uniref:ElyC/SanA/YdcF family protein n=1 Tax=Pseudonocardia nematodicida TaxID=1206997 RepID=A0ABV1KFA0_9PSEU
MTSPAAVPASRVLGVVVGVLALLGGLVVAVANVIVVQRAAEDLTTQVSLVRPAHVAIVPGSHVHPDGSLGAVVAERVDAAVDLYHRGTVDVILMSGAARAGYDEPGPMRDAALAAGVAPEDVFTDYAGFDTWHTMRRANDVFGVTTAVVVTQDLYAARAALLADAAGLEVQVLTTGGGDLFVREWLARVRGLWSATVRPDVATGPPIPIDGDGRDSWVSQR